MFENEFAVADLMRYNAFEGRASLTARAKGTRNHGIHHLVPFYRNPLRHPAPGPKYGRSCEVPLGYPGNEIGLSQRL